MAYLGRGIENLSDRVVLDSLTASATASYTLQLNSVNFVPSSASSLTVSLNGVIQKPDSSYTVSGSTLTFSSALTSSDSIDFVIAERGITLQTPSAGSVNTDQLAASAVTNAKIAAAAAIATSKLGTGAVLQIQHGIRDTEFTTTSNGYVDVSNMTFTLTPKSTSSKILVFAFGRSGSGAGNVEIRWRILRDSTTVNAGRDMFSGAGGGVFSASIFCFGIDQPNSTSSLTYKLQGLCENNVDQARIVAANDEVNQEAYLVGIEIAG